MSKFFITHSWKDIEFATRLCDDLRKHGLDGFFDAYSIRPGDDIAGRISRGLEECEVYLPLLSPAALESRWCELEINAAINLSLEQGRGGRPRIIPLLIAPCQLPALLRGRLYISFHQRYDDALKQLLKEFGVTVQPPAPPQPTHATPTADPPKPAPAPPPPTPAPTPALSRDEQVHLYTEARALQAAGDLRDAAALYKKLGDYRDAPARLQKIQLDLQIQDYNKAYALQAEGKLHDAAALYEKLGNYRDAAARLRKIQLYLAADEAMKQALADKDDRAEPWLEAHARLEELLQLDPQFLDARAKLEITNRWLALPETYERLLDALDADDWAKAFTLFEQIRSVKPNYKRTQTLSERALPQMVQAGVTKKVGKDGKELLLVPEGEFVMGEGSDAHTVYLDAFYISRYPVTNAEYKKFVDATKRQPPSHWQNGKIPLGKENHPVVYVTWDDANAYAQWAGARLPTEAEWEKAASWDDIKKEKRVYPWGNQFDASKCNSSESGIGDTTPVGKYSPQGDSFYGVADMAGNVWEWCADRYDLRGGSWSNDQVTVRAACRIGSLPDVVLQQCRCAGGVLPQRFWVLNSVFLWGVWGAQFAPQRKNFLKR